METIVKGGGGEGGEKEEEGNFLLSLTHLTLDDRRARCSRAGRSIRGSREIRGNLLDFLAAFCRRRRGPRQGKNASRAEGRQDEKGCGKQQETRIDYLMGWCHVPDVPCGSQWILESTSSQQRRNFFRLTT